MIYTRETPPSKPPLSDTSFQASQLREVWENKHLPDDIRSEALDFLRIYAPSKRTTIWKNRVESFLKNLTLFFSTNSN